MIMGKGLAVNLFVYVVSLSRTDPRSTLFNMTGFICLWQYNGLLFLPSAGNCIGGVVTAGSGRYSSRAAIDTQNSLILDFSEKSLSSAYIWGIRHRGFSVRSVELAS